VKTLESLKSALSELEKEQEVGGKIEGVKRVERSAIPRRHVSVSSFAT
jgi:hypothetical protein